jgi:hypothetical protein
MYAAIDRSGKASVADAIGVHGWSGPWGTTKIAVLRVGENKLLRKKTGKIIWSSSARKCCGEEDRAYWRCPSVPNGSSDLGDGTTVFQRMLGLTKFIILKKACLTFKAQKWGVEPLLCDC